MTAEPQKENPARVDTEQGQKNQHNTGTNEADNSSACVEVQATVAAKQPVEAQREYAFNAYNHYLNPKPGYELSVTFADFCPWLQRQTKQIPSVEAKYTLPLWSPHKLHTKHRTSENVEYLSMLVFDLDDDAVATVHKFASLVDCTFLLHSTPRHTKEHSKLRLVVPLSRDAAPAEHLRIWLYFAETLKLAVDDQCKDAARQFFIPAYLPGVEPVFHVEEGDPLDVDEWLAKVPAVAANDVVATATPTVKEPSLGLLPPETKDKLVSALQFIPSLHAMNQRARLLGGWMGHAGFQDADVSDVTRRVFTAGGSDDPEARVNDALGAAREAREGKPRWGWPKLIEVMGKPQVEGIQRLIGCDVIDTEAFAPKRGDEEQPDTLIDKYGNFYFLGESGYSHAVTPPQIESYCKANALEQYFTDTKSGQKFQASVLKQWAKPIRKTEVRYSQANNSFKDGVLTKGLRLRPGLEPRFDADVDEYLAALAGDQKPALEQWIATLRQDRLDEIAVALALIGPKAIGKNGFVVSLAHLWEEAGDSPAPGDALVARFNSQLEYCPVVHVDEAFPKDLDVNKFKHVVTDYAPKIERKGQEIFTLNGAIRLVVTVNNAAALQFGGRKNADDIAACADRFLVIQVADSQVARIDAAQDRIRREGSSKWDMDRVACHWLYLMATVEIKRNKRFVGPDPDAHAIELVQRGEAERFEDIWDVVEESLDEDRYGSMQEAIRIFSGDLYVNPKRFAMLNELQERRVREALSHLRVERAPRKVAGKSVTFWRLDTQRLPAEVRNALALRRRDEMVAA